MSRKNAAILLVSIFVCFDFETVAYSFCGRLALEEIEQYLERVANSQQ